MVYIPISQRKKEQQKQGYVPVSQRVKPAQTTQTTQPKPQQPEIKGTFMPDTENVPWYNRPINPNSALGRFYSFIRPDSTPARFVSELPSAAARTAGGFFRGGMAAGKTGVDLFTGKDIADEDETVFQPKSRVGQSISESLFGEPDVKIPNLPKYGQEFTESFGFKTENNFANFAIGGILAGLDFTTGGAGDDAIKAIAKSKSPETIKTILRDIGILDDLAETAAPKLAKIADEAEVKQAIESMAKTQESTRAVPKATSTLEQEARKYKTPDEFVREVNKKDWGSMVTEPSEFRFRAVDPQDIVKDSVKLPFDTEGFIARDGNLLRVVEKQTGRFMGKASTILDNEATAIKKAVADALKNMEEFGRKGVREGIEVSLKAPKDSFSIYWNKIPDETLTDLWRRVNGKAPIESVIKKTAEAELPPLPKLPKSVSQNLPELTTQGRQSQPQLESSSLPEQPQPQITPQQAVLPVDTPRTPSISSDGSNLPVVNNRSAFGTTIQPKSKVVKSDSKPTTLSPSVYESNRNFSVGSGSRLQSAFSGIKEVIKGAGKLFDKGLAPISTRLKNIDPSLKRALRDFEFKLGRSVQGDRQSVENWLKGVRKIDIGDYADLDLALKNGDAAKTKEIISKYGLEKEFAKVRKTLDELYERAKAVGYDIGYEQNYFPRRIKDAEGFLEYLSRGDDWNIIDEAIKAKETELGRYLDMEEKANLINTMIRGYQQGKITLSETGAMKNRTIDIVDAELNQFYDDSVNSLISYIDSTNEAIEARRFFGKADKSDKFANLEDSIGSYILNLLADGKIKPSQEKELRDILQARFNPKSMSGILRVYKNLSYIDTMGSITSAITQIGDLAFALYRGGITETAKAAGRAVVNKSKITRADIGIEKIAQEFEDASRSAKAVDTVFTIIGLKKLDQIGKETLINASIGKARKLAEKPTDEFMRRLQAVFGNETEQVIKDLKAGETTENVKMLAFSDLLDFQPAALSEMPEQYLKGGNGRIFYMLKTYTVKLLDVYRNEVFQVIKENPVQGMKNLMYLTGALLAMNVTADEIKDFILGRETSWKDRTIDNILKLAGFSKFTIYKAREEGIGSAAAKTILPPFKFIDSVYKDLNQAEEVSQLQTIDSIPVGGKLYYWWFGKGRTKTENKKTKGKGSGDFPTLPELPKLPKLPSLPEVP